MSRFLAGLLAFALSVGVAFGQGAPITAPSPIQHARVTLASAQILTLATVPVVIIPAPGAGQIIVTLQGSATLNFGTTAYATATPTLSLVFAALPAVFAISATSATFLTQAASVTDGMRGFNGVNFATASAVNSAVSATLSGSNPTLGDGTIDIDIFYVIVTP